MRTYIEYIAVSGIGKKEFLRGIMFNAYVRLKFFTPIFVEIPEQQVSVIIYTPVIIKNKYFLILLFISNFTFIVISYIYFINYSDWNTLGSIIDKREKGLSFFLFF